MTQDKAELCFLLHHTVIPIISHAELSCRSLLLSQSLLMSQK